MVFPQALLQMRPMLTRGRHIPLGGALLLYPLGGPQEGVVGQAAALGAGEAAGADVVVVLADAAVGVVDLEALEGVGGDAVAGGEEGRLEGLGGGEALDGVELEEAG